MLMLLVYFGIILVGFVGFGGIGPGTGILWFELGIISVWTVLWGIIFYKFRQSNNSSAEQEKKNQE